jgi:poly(A) polymerase
MLDWIRNKLPLAPRHSKTPGHKKKAGEVVASAKSLGIDRHCISENALRTLQKLQDAGYQAYIVGGGVRDILLGLRPKDFDIATCATPEQVRQVFRHSRIIGRRFRIVHVLWGRDTIEVTTFRGHHSNAADSSHGESSDKGLLLRDNVYGTLEEDALRRDFTVNALYYGLDGKVQDFCDGLKDLKSRQIRMIGEPEVRYREDPVRMLRAIRLAAKLDFSVEKRTAAPIQKLAPLLHDISNARLFDEVIKLFMGGHALRTYDLLQTYHLFPALFPGPARHLHPGSNIDNLVRHALTNTDHRVLNDQRVTPAFLFAALLWPCLLEQKQHAEQSGLPPYQALHHAGQRVLSEQLKRTGIPKRFSVPMQEIWDMQFQLERRHGSRAERLMEQTRFRAAYDFLLLREQAGEDLGGLGAWWTTYQSADSVQREEMSQRLLSESPRSGRRRSGKRKKKSPSGPSIPTG